jgi:hypothetical protein
MNGFIEVAYNADKIIINVRHIVFVEKTCGGCRITLRVGGPGEEDGSINSTDDYGDVKQAIVTAVGKA